MQHKLRSTIIAFLIFAPLSVYAIENSSSTLGEEQFGDCDPDTIYDTSYVAKTVVNGRLRDVACMSGSKTLAVIPKNGKVQVVAKTDGWYKVVTTDGKTGWMGAKLLTKTTEKVSGDAVKKYEIKAENFGQLVSILSSLTSDQLYTLKNKILARLAELESKPKETPVSTNGIITLQGSATGEKIALSWAISDVNVDQGFKVAVATHENPVYPGDDYHYISDSGARSDEWSATPGTYYFRVCQYLGGKCGLYSNNVKVVVAGTPTADNTTMNNGSGTITLNGSVVGKVVKLNWSLSGMTSKMGYKIVYSTNENPVYPGNEYHYLSSEGNVTDEWNMSPGTYYFRVCEYLGGKCGVYSNNLKVVVQ